VRFLLQHSHWARSVLGDLNPLSAHAIADARRHGEIPERSCKPAAAVFGHDPWKDRPRSTGALKELPPIRSI